MPEYQVTLAFTGSATIYVRAVDEREAVDLAMDEFDPADLDGDILGAEVEPT